MLYGAGCKRCTREIVGKDNITESKTSTDVKGVDEPTLEEAQRVLGIETPKDTVNAALREVVRKKLVEEFFSFMSDQDSGRTGDFAS